MQAAGGYYQGIIWKKDRRCIIHRKGKRMKIGIYTLGCKVNQYETQAMERELAGRGHELVPFEAAADAYIVNTCTVTAVSDKKSRQMIRRARKRSPQAVVAVCGCYAQTRPEEVRALEVDLIAGTGDRMGFLDLLEQAAREREPLVSLDEALRRRQFEVLPAGGLAARTRAMLNLLHYPLCQGPSPLPASGDGGGRGPPPGGGGLPGAGGHGY